MSRVACVRCILHSMCQVHDNAWDRLCQRTVSKMAMSHFRTCQVYTRARTHIDSVCLRVQVSASSWTRRSSKLRSRVRQDEASESHCMQIKGKARESEREREGGGGGGGGVGGGWVEI